MLAFFNKKREEQSQQTTKRRLPLTLWFFYLGILSMALTGVTFSRYSTVVRGTVSVQVADSFPVIFMDADGETEIATTRVYEGQQIKHTPDMYGVEAVLFDARMDTGDFIFSDEDTVYRTFLGWSLDGETIVDPTDIPVDQDLIFIAVYEILPEAPVATPSDATPSDATPSNATPSNAEI